jgi:hypothetical protein
MTTDFTDNTKAVLPNHLFAFFWFFHQFLHPIEGWQHWIPWLPSAKHRSPLGKYRWPSVKHRFHRVIICFYRLPFYHRVQILCQSISNNSILTLLSATDCNRQPTPRLRLILVSYRYQLSTTFSTTEVPRLTHPRYFCSITHMHSSKFHGTYLPCCEVRLCYFFKLYTVRLVNWGL